MITARRLPALALIVAALAGGCGDPDTSDRSTNDSTLSNSNDSTEASLPAPPTERTLDLSKHFAPYHGCFVLLEMGTNSYTRHNAPRCDSAFSPCSTFKIFNTLAGLEAGVLTDENTTFKWDSTDQPFEIWEQDQTLRQAITRSVVWYYRRVAAGVGAERMQHFLDTVGYGNRDISSGLTNFWLYPNSLRITPNQQVSFVERLYRNELPFSPRATELTRRLLVRREWPGGTFSGKTGSGLKDGRIVLGWFVGHLRSGDREFAFATNIQGADSAWGSHAQKITESILEEMKLMPADSLAPR